MRRLLVTLVLAYLGLGTLTGCGLLDAWRDDTRGSNRVANRTNPHRQVITHPAPTPIRGGGATPTVLPDRMPSAPKLLPTTGKRVPIGGNEIIEVVPTVIETPDVRPIENIITPKIKGL